MWLLHLLPDGLIQFIVHTILILGLVGSIASFALINILIRWSPAIANYYRPVQLISMILLVSGVYFEGGYSTEMIWREKMRELEGKITAAEEQAKKANEELEKKYEDKVKTVKGKTVIVKQYIDREIVKYDNQCKIPDEFVKAHNQSAGTTK